METAEPETPGTIIARRIREHCNTMTKEERERCLRKGMRIIYASKEAMKEAGDWASEKYAPVFRRLAE